MWGGEMGTDRDYEEFRVPSGFPWLWLDSTTSSLSSSLSTYWMDQYGGSEWAPWLLSTHFTPCLPGKFNSFQPILRLTQGDKGYHDGHKGELVAGNCRRPPGYTNQKKTKWKEVKWLTWKHSANEHQPKRAVSHQRVTLVHCAKVN